MLGSDSCFFDETVQISGSACFVSDAHLGAPNRKASAERETMLVDMLNQHRNEIQHLFLLGDIFDFWFEYRDVVPRGFFRFFNLLHELREQGVQIYYFTGNHDMWVQDYFTESFGCRIFRHPQLFVINGRRCLIGHGDGLGGNQRRYLFIKKILGMRVNQKLYSMLHPRQAFAIARKCSTASRASHAELDTPLPAEREHQVQYARQVLRTTPVDCFIFAHRHVPMRVSLSETSTLYNSGDWLSHFSYLLWTSDTPEICYWKKEVQ